VSKAFTDEEAAEPAPLVPPRAPLPDGVPNYVTPRGLALLRRELALLQARRAEAERQPEGAARAQALAVLATQRSLLEQRIASAEPVPLPAQPCDTVRFGASVRVAGSGDAERCYRIVGVDEADAAQGRIAFVSPLARALLGREPGDRVRLRTPRGEQELEIVAVDYETEPACG
jgi:transcription elongation factor GreB